MSVLASAKLKDVCSQITDGTHDSPELQSSGVPFIKGKHISNGYVDFENCDYITHEEHLKVISRSKPEIGNILFANIGNSIGDMALIKSDVEFSIKNVALIKANKEIIDNIYLYYYMLNGAFQNELKNRKQGAAQPFISLALLREHTIHYHKSPTTQRKIAGVLSAYDDLIENNNKRIKILEEMAQKLYKEWFVDFNFPNHETTKFIDSDLGKIPAGWGFDTLKNIAVVVMGQSPQSQFYNELGEGLPFHQGVTNFGDRFPADKTYCTKETRIANQGDILFSVRAPVGRMNLCNKKIIIGRGVSALRSKSGNQTFLFYQLKNQFAKEDSMGSGAIFNAVTKSDMEDIKLLKPDNQTIEKYEKIAVPISKEIEVLVYKVDNLRKTRDLLLPRLISGELSVEDLESPIGDP